MPLSGYQVPCPNRAGGRARSMIEWKPPLYPSRLPSKNDSRRRINETNGLQALDLTSRMKGDTLTQK